MGKVKKLIKNIIIFGLGSLSIKIVQFFIMPILTTYLTVDEFGITEIFNNIIDLGIPLFTLGIADSLFRFSIEKSNSQSEIFSNGLVTMLICILVSIIIFPLIYFFIQESYILLMLPLVIFTALKKLLAEFTRGNGKVLIYSIAGILESIFLLIGSYIFLIFFKWGLFGYILTLNASSIGAILIYIIFTKPIKYIKLKEINWIKLKEMIKFSFPNVPNMVSWWLVQTSSKYILIGFCGLSIASLYMASSKIPALINIVSSIFMQAWSLTSSEVCKDSDRDNFYTLTFKFYSFIVEVAVVLIIMLSPIISKILLKGEFYEAWIYSPILIVSGGLGCISSYFGAFYTAFYDTKTAMYTTFLGGIINLILSFTLIPFIGVYGAMVANLIGYIFIVISRIKTTSKYVNVDIRWTKHIIIFILILLQAVTYTVKFKYANIISLTIVFIIIILNKSDFSYLLKYIKKSRNK